MENLKNIKNNEVTFPSLNAKIKDKDVCVKPIFFFEPEDKENHDSVLIPSDTPFQNAYREFETEIKADHNAAVLGTISSSAKLAISQNEYLVGNEFERIIRQNAYAIFCNGDLYHYLYDCKLPDKEFEMPKFGLSIYRSDSYRINFNDLYETQTKEIMITSITAAKTSYAIELGRIYYDYIMSIVFDLDHSSFIDMDQLSTRIYIESGIDHNTADPAYRLQLVCNCLSELSNTDINKILDMIEINYVYATSKYAKRRKMTKPTDDIIEKMNHASNNNSNIDGFDF